MKKLSTQKGFTLVETLVAIFVLTLSITGPLFIAQQSFTSAITARDRTTASFLAQEGIEYIRSVRDYNYLSNPGEDWLAGLSECIGADKACAVDPIGTYPLIIPCSAGVCDPLEKTSGGIFGYQSGVEETKFIRTITITEEGISDVDGNPAEVLVVVKVSWTQKGVTRTTTVQERLFNWL